MSERQTATIDITLAGETRPVEFYYWTHSDGTEGLGHTGQIFTGQIGRGTKRHAAHATLFEMDRDTARRMGYTPSTYRQASNGRWYAIKLADNALNRQVRITGWRDVEPHSSRHIMERASSQQETPQVSTQFQGMMDGLIR